jgi:hypothetical protein
VIDAGLKRVLLAGIQVCLPKVPDDRLQEVYDYIAALVVDRSTKMKIQ